MFRFNNFLRGSMRLPLIRRNNCFSTNKEVDLKTKFKHLDHEIRQLKLREMRLVKDWRMESNEIFKKINFHSMMIGFSIILYILKELKNVKASIVDENVD